jgi:hypothetical protein
MTPPFRPGKQAKSRDALEIQTKRPMLPVPNLNCTHR